MMDVTALVGKRLLYHAPIRQNAMHRILNDCHPLSAGRVSRMVPICPVST